MHYHIDKPVSKFFSYCFQNVIIQAAFPEDYFKVHLSTTNGTYHTVTTVQKGKTNIDGALTTIIRQVTSIIYL